MVSGEYENALVELSGTMSIYATNEGECIQVMVLDPLAASANRNLRCITRNGAQVVQVLPLAPDTNASLWPVGTFLVVYRAALLPDSPDSILDYEE